MIAWMTRCVLCLKVYDWLDEVEKKSDVMSQEVIGTSVEGRPIRIVKVNRTIY